MRQVRQGKSSDLQKACYWMYASSRINPGRGSKCDLLVSDRYLTMSVGCMSDLDEVYRHGVVARGLTAGRLTDFQWYASPATKTREKIEDIKRICRL